MKLEAIVIMLVCIVVGVVMLHLTVQTISEASEEIQLAQEHCAEYIGTHRIEWINNSGCYLVTSGGMFGGSTLTFLGEGK